jgi:hypothetical protein
MNQLRNAVRDYLTMRRGLGFKLVRHEAALREFMLSEHCCKLLKPGLLSTRCGPGPITACLGCWRSRACD